MRLSIVFIFLMAFSLHGFGQKENNNWYFGRNAGISFTGSSLVSLDSSAMDAYEGSISISDPDGKVLFYSNGETIWNRNHVPMQNGTGLMGHRSATQAVLAVPQPGSLAIYYIFTVDAVENNLQNGLRYSILDMNLDGGLGGITNVKNILLEGSVTEKLTVGRHGNNKDYWVLAHKWNSDEFVAYELTNKGLSKSSVISKVGLMHRGSVANAGGQIKMNREGTKIALAIGGLGKIEIFDFNPFTGVISNVLTGTTFYSPYGIEFSGDGTKLYTTVNIYNPNNYFLLQFNLADPAGINAVIKIFSGSENAFALQIGPNNKIYCNTNYYLGVINEPDSIGLTCNYNSNSNGFNLKGNNGNLGLPTMVTPALKRVSEIRIDTTFCLGESITLGQDAVSGNSYFWQDGSTKSTYLVAKPGRYLLTVKKKNFDEEFDFNVQFKDCTPKIPNIITPNQDRLNDTFVLQEYNAAKFELQIFNRWGSLIYQTESYQNDWDAKGNSAGMYYYFLRNSETGKTFKGWLEVVK